MILTKPQRESLHKVYRRYRDSDYKPCILSYRDFRRTVAQVFQDDCILVVCNGITIGIEQNGYTHT